MEETVKADGTMAIVAIPGDQTTLLEKALSRPSNELMAYITDSTGGKSSPYLLTPGATYSSAQSLPQAPVGTTRVTRTIDGFAYFPLVASCPAASCTNGDPIANAIPDAGTSAYNEAVARKVEKDFNIATSLSSLGGVAVRSVAAMTELATTAGAVARITEAVEAGSATTLSASLGKTLGKYSAVDPGPLVDNMAGTFAGAKYHVVELQRDTTLFRAGTANQPLGQFFSAEAPTSVLQTRVDQAVLPVWPGGGTSPLDTAFAVKIPKGTHVYVGEIGAQGGFYVGGTQQIVIVKPWAIPGVQVIKSIPLK